MARCLRNTWLLALAVACGACRIGGLKPEVTRRIDSYGGAPIVVGDALFYLDRESIVRWRGSEIRSVRIIGQDCANATSLSDSWQEVSADGEHALVTATSAVHGGLFLHGNRSYTTISCWIDFAQGTALPLDRAWPAAFQSFSSVRYLSARHLYNDASFSPVRMTELSSGNSVSLSDTNYEVCAISESGTSALFACLNRVKDHEGQIKIISYDVSAWPPRLVERSEAAIELPSDSVHLAFSPDGSRLVYSGYNSPDPYPADAERVVAVFDLRSRKLLFIEKQRSPFSLSSAQLSANGRWLFLNEDADAKHDFESRARILSMAGAEVLRFSLGSARVALLPLGPDDRFWLMMDGKAYLLRISVGVTPERSER